MKIIRAAEMGMCFGVRDALQITKEIADPTQVTIHGELVHNPNVIAQLNEAGFVQSPEDDRQTIPPTPLVLITAHGISTKERNRLEANRKQLIDNTRRLAQLCQQHNVPALHVTCASEIDPDWFGGAQTIGLTAGTSTLDETINQVHERLNQIAIRKQLNEA